jgi:hypothetical protein
MSSPHLESYFNSTEQTRPVGVYMGSEIGEVMLTGFNDPAKLEEAIKRLYESRQRHVDEAEVIQLHTESPESQAA